MKTFESVAQLKLAKLKDGQQVTTKGYYTAGDGGNALYLIKTPQSSDGYGDHELANGNVAVLQGTRTTGNFGCIGATDKQTNWNAFVQSGGGAFNSSFNVETFPTALDDGTNTAAIATGSLKVLYVSGEITGISAGVSNSLIGVDATAGLSNVSVDINGLVVKGTTRFRAYSATINARLKDETLSDIKTDSQSIVSSSKVERNKTITNNLLGLEVTESTNISPQISVTSSDDSDSIFSDSQFVISNNKVWTGTEAVNSAFFFSSIPSDSVISENYHYNLGKSLTEGFDIDGIGSRATVINNHAIYSGFEYKQSSSKGYDNARDVVFSGNFSFEQINPNSAAFSILSSACADNNTAYNPAGWGFFCAGITSNDIGSNENGPITGAGNKVIYAGNPDFDGALCLGGSTGKALGNINFDPFDCYIDPVYALNNPGVKIPVSLIQLVGDSNNIRIANGKMAACTSNQILIRADTNCDNIIFENLDHGDTDDACYDLSKVTRLRIINPRLPDNIGDRPFRMSAVSKSSIVSEEHPNIVNAATSNSGTGFIINGMGIESGLATGVPPTATGNIWAVGVTVENPTAPATLWVRVNSSTTPSIAFVQVG